MVDVWEMLTLFVLPTLYAWFERTQTRVEVEVSKNV
jgi:hypothetical protein